MNDDELRAAWERLRSFLDSLGIPKDHHAEVIGACNAALAKVLRNKERLLAAGSSDRVVSRLMGKVE